MHRVLLSFILLCVSAHPVHAEIFTAQDMRSYKDHVWAASCDNPANHDKYEIRRPTPAEAQEYGDHVLLFTYLNSVRKCSDDLRDVGVWFEGARIGLLNVEVLSTNYDDREKVSFTTFHDSGYQSFQDEPLYLHDSDEEAIIVLYPAMF